MHTNHWLFRPILFFVSIGSFLISWIFTCNLLASLATGGFAMAIAFGLATVLEPAKIVFHAVGIANRDLFALIVGIVLTLMSIVGTLGWLQVQHAEKIALATHSSAGFQGLQSQITSLEQQIKNLQETANGLPENYHTRRQNLMEEANQLLAQKNELTEKLAGYAPATGLASNALYTSLGKFFGNTDPTLVELWINATYGILLELVAIISGVYVFKHTVDQRRQAEAENVVSNQHQLNQKRMESLTEGTPQETIEYDREQESVPVSSRKTKSNHYFRQEYDDEDDEDDLSLSDIKPVLPNYVEGLFSKVGKGGRLQGRRSAAENVGITKSLADQCHHYLKKLGVIEVRGNATYARISKDEMLEIVNNS